MSDTADLLAQRDKALELRDLNTRLTTVIDRNSDLMRQLTAVAENLRRNAPNEKEALNEAESALKELKSLRDETLLRPIQGLGYRQYPRLREEITTLYSSVSRSISRPTDPQVQRSGELAVESATATAAQQTIVDTRIAKLNQLLKNLPHVMVPGGAIM